MTDKHPDRQIADEKLQNPADWLKCPHCGNDDVELSGANPWDHYRTHVKCGKCGASGFFER